MNGHDNSRLLRAVGEARMDKLIRARVRVPPFAERMAVASLNLMAASYCMNVLWFKAFKELTSADVLARIMAPPARARDLKPNWEDRVRAGAVIADLREDGRAAARRRRQAINSTRVVSAKADREAALRAKYPRGAGNPSGGRSL